MISYFDAQRGTERAPEAWRAAEWNLSERLLAVVREFGDRTHVSGDPDYVVRFLENIPALGVATVNSWFVVSGGSDKIEVLELAEGDPGVTMTSVQYESDWVTTIEERFRDFRRRLDQS